MREPKYKFDELVEHSSTKVRGIINEVFCSEKLPDEIVYKMYMEDFRIEYYNEKSLQKLTLRKLPFESI